MSDKKLKHFFDRDLVSAIAREIAAAYPAFDRGGFGRAALAGLESLELTPRAWHIAEALHRFLPSAFPAAADIIVASLGPEIPATGENGIAPLRYLPHVFFVQKYGLDDFEPAMSAQYELTKRFSAESSIRAFLVRYQDRTLARLRQWAADDNAHVRRLVSEGTRPRLPWTPRLRAFQEDPRPVIELLEVLRDDPVRYVQRSVANNINDIAKDHAELAVDLCRRWMIDAPPGRVWIVKHALRSLVKAANAGALATMGAKGWPKVKVAKADVPAEVAIGGRVHFAFTLMSTGRRPQDLLIDFVVHFAKARGRSSPKVFKLTRAALGPGESRRFEGTVSLQDLTTRKHYPGRHRLEAQINGVIYPIGEFLAVAPQGT
jgi:3-methyladenine DNA glycosylase AlkC